MQNIIYKSDSIIPWDTQSAFKMTSYNTDKEENMIFCYLKAYVHKNDLVLCSYCFTENTEDFDNIHLYINPNPEKSRECISVHFGFDGIKSADYNGCDYSDRILFSSFKTDDEQGFYWCGEVTLPDAFIRELFINKPEENSIVTINMVQTFSNGDFAVLSGDRKEENYRRTENMGVFVVLNY